MNQYYRKKRQLPGGRRHLFSRNFVAFILLVTVFALLHLWQKNNVKQMLVEISQMQRRVDNMVQENRQLQAKMFEMSTNVRLREIAEKRLAMVDPGNPPKVVFYQSKDKKENPPNPMLASMLADGDNLAFLNPITLVETVEK